MKEVLKDCETCIHQSVCSIRQELSKVPILVWEQHIDIYENECRSYLPTGLLECANQEYDSIPFDSDTNSSISSKVFNLYPNGEDLDNPIADISQWILEFIQRNPDIKPKYVCLSEETQKEIMEYYNKLSGTKQADSLLYFDVGVAKVPVRIDNAIEYGNFEIEY